MKSNPITTAPEQISFLLDNLSDFTFLYLLSGGIILLITSSVISKSKEKHFSSIIFIVTLLLSFFFKKPIRDFYNLFSETGHSAFFFALSHFAGLLCCFLIEKSPLSETEKKTEIYILLLFAICGTSLLSTCSNLLTIFIGLESISIPLYCLAAFGINSRSSEGALKYVLYGSAASGIMLFGISLIYGITNELEIDQLTVLIAQTEGLLFNAGLLMFMSGLLFKIAAFPFYYWAPDVYEGSPIPLVAFFSVAPKALAFYVLIICEPLLLTEKLQPVLLIVSILSMTIGNLLALNQTNVKRLLAYSSVSHGGFLLMGVAAGGSHGAVYIMYYFIIYLLMNFSAFHLLQIITRWKNSEDIEDFAGLAKINPYLATSLLITMISLTGLPPAAGFSAKLFMFSGVYDTYKATNNQGIFIMLAAGLINTVLSLFYYLKMPYYAFFRDNDENGTIRLTNGEKGFILTLNALLLLFFVKPDWVFVLIQLTQNKG